MSGITHSLAWLRHVLTGDPVYSTVSLFDGFEANLEIVAGAATRTVTFPVTWVWLGPRLSMISAGAVAGVALRCNGTTDANMIAAYAVSA